MLSGANRVIEPVSDLASAVHMPPSLEEQCPSCQRPPVRSGHPGEQQASSAASNRDYVCI